MIHEIGVELQTKLRAKGCPISVYDRERTKPATWGRERIVIEQLGDGYGPARSHRANPKHRMTRSMSVKVSIFAQSAKDGALEFEHRRRCEHVLDLVLVALGDVLAARLNGWTIKGGDFVVPADLENSEAYGGAVYELSIVVDRAVYVQKWDGSIGAEATLDAVTTTTKASLKGGVDDDSNFSTPPAIAETV